MNEEIESGLIQDVRDLEPAALAVSPADGTDPAKPRTGDSDGTDAEDDDGTDSGDADGTDSDSDGTDSTDADGTDGDGDGTDNA